MSKIMKMLIASCICIIFLVGTVCLLGGEVTERQEENIFSYLSNRDVMAVKEVTVNNQYGEYKVQQEEGGFIVHDLPLEQVNGDYLLMLLDESSKIEYIDVANENPEDLSIYGLDNPVATVEIHYTDGEKILLEIGNDEPISKGIYFKEKEHNEVLIMKKSRSIRFTMPVTEYIHYQIIPMCITNSPLSIVKDIRFTGRLLRKPITIEAIDETSEEDMRRASSFGVATHVVTEPVLHEINQTACIEIFNSLMGLMSEGIVAYNCTEEELDGYGFDNPLLEVAFSYQNIGEEVPTHVVLKVAEYDGGLIAIRDEQGIVHRILDVPFTQIRYEDIVMRWFLTPFITDLSSVKLELREEEYVFEFRGESNKELQVSLGDKPLDIELFRDYYALLVSASHNGERVVGELTREVPVMTLEFSYRDEKKEKDMMKLYKEEARTLSVEVNGVREFKMREKYLEVVQKGLEALIKGEVVSKDW